MWLNLWREASAIVCATLLMSWASRGAIAAAGPLRVHPTNPRYFTDGTKNADGSLKAVYLTGSHTWNNFQHNGVYPPVDYDEYLDFLTKHNHNFIRLWVWEQGGWDPWAAGHVVVEPVAYARTGPGDALDGKPKYDLAKFNDAYFDRLRLAPGRGSKTRHLYFDHALRGLERREERPGGQSLAGTPVQQGQQRQRHRRRSERRRSRTGDPHPRRSRRRSCGCSKPTCAGSSTRSTTWTTCCTRSATRCTSARRRGSTA